MKFKNMLVLIFLFSVFVISCDPEAKSEQSEISENASDLETRAIPVEALIVKSNTVEQSVPLTGILKPLYEVDIVAEVSGKATEIKKNLGDKVLKGDILAIIDDEVALSNYKQAKAQVLSAENNMKIAQLNLKSDKELFENGDISKLAFENSTLTVKTAEANHLLAMANLSLLKKAFEDNPHALILVCLCISTFVPFFDSGIFKSTLGRSLGGSKRFSSITD